MDTPRRPHRVSLFAKFTAVILLLGIVPIVLLVTVLQSRMLTEYRASLEDAYQDAIAYSAYSIRVRLDTYTDLSKFCYYYNYSSQGIFLTTTTITTTCAKSCPARFLPMRTMPLTASVTKWGCFCTI